MSKTFRIFWFYILKEILQFVCASYGLGIGSKWAPVHKGHFHKNPAEECKTLNRLHPFAILLLLHKFYQIDVYVSLMTTTEHAHNLVPKSILHMHETFRSFRISQNCMRAKHDTCGRLNCIIVLFKPCTIPA